MLKECKCEVVSRCMDFWLSLFRVRTLETSFFQFEALCTIFKYKQLLGSFSIFTVVSLFDMCLTHMFIQVSCRAEKATADMW